MHQDQHHQQPIARMSRDIAKAGSVLTDTEARFLVDAYYTAQEDRKRSFNQERALGETKEPNSVLTWLAEQSEVLENQIKRALDKYTEAHPMGTWMRSIVGIGPVISAGILAYIDIAKAPTAGHIWRYAGLDPTQKWTSATDAEAWVKENGVDVEKAAIAFNVSYDTMRRMASTDREGQPITPTAKSLAGAICRRPWNAQLKTLTWKLGQSFMKLSNRDDCFYGKIYRERKAYEIDRNDRGVNRELALSLSKRVGRSTEAYKHLSDGKLPPGQIDARARRYAVKMFLSHLHGEWYQLHHGRPAPAPFPIAHLGHAHVVEPPVRLGDLVLAKRSSGK